MSFNSSDDDGQQRFALGFLFALIALVVSTVVGVVVYQRGIARAPQTAPAGVLAGSDATPLAAAAPGVVVTEEATVVVEGGVVRFYFATGKAELAPGASEALADVVNGMKAGKAAAVSGYHDATGDAALNAELAKQRAIAVRDALLALGVAESQVELRKPEITQAGGSNAEGRRVEVILLP